MTSELLAENDRLRRRYLDAEALLDTALDNAPFGFVFVDLDCRYIRVNRVLTRPTGRDPSLYPGKTVREMVPQIADAVEAIVRRVRETGEPYLDYDLSIGRFIQKFNSYPVRAHDGTLVGVCSFVIDITERTGLLDELRHALGMRDEFIQVASHELRTPMTIIKLQARLIRGLLDHEGLTEKSAESLKSLAFELDHQVNGLSRLVDDMLDASRSSERKLTMKFEQVELGQLVREVLTSLRAQLDKAGCRISCGSDTSYELRGDRFRLEQVVHNLVSNAVKYGAGKPIEVTLRCLGQEIELSVRDQGLGIAPKDHKRIFERYERAVEDKHITGLGLGLYIARRIVEAHGGTVGVESTLGQGSCFTVRLPVTSSDPR